jgi:hypothetical protein
MNNRGPRLFRLAVGVANPTLHQTPETLAVLAGAGGGAGELDVRHKEECMEIWLRHKKAVSLEVDEKITVESQKEWHELIYDPKLVSSILWPSIQMFKIDLKNMKRKHHHEIDYANNNGRNLSFLNGCRELAQKLDSRYAGSRCLVYAPLRGALPIWRGISQFVKHIECIVYYPVTSSFIFYPEEFGILGKRNRTASGRYNNRFELERILPFVGGFDFLLYVDEIVSGGMMQGHLKDMFRLKVNQQIPIVAVGLADANGERSVSNRMKFGEFIELGKLKDFIWAGCVSLITEDQKFLLGAHYVDYQLGPHVVPVLNESLRFYPEKIKFDETVYSVVAEQGAAPDRFSATLQCGR